MHKHDQIYGNGCINKNMTANDLKWIINRCKNEKKNEKCFT